MKQKYYSNQEKKKIIRKAGFVILFLTIVCIAGGIVLHQIDSQKVVPTSAEEEDTVKINNIACTPKANLQTYLIMGIDADGKPKVRKEYDGTGQCDVMELLVIDKMENTYTVLPINRDTITDVKSLDEEGNYLATTKVQIALAHANGDGMEQSCENTVDAVSNLLYGQKIDGYAALNMDAIKILNHMAGGVTVTIEDDFSKEDPTLVEGETVKLTDEQAVSYVRGRMSVGDGTNESRMRRQHMYLSALKSILMEKCRQNESYAMELYDGLSDYMVTDMTEKDFSRITKAILKNEDLGELQIEGTNKTDDMGFNAFTPDKDSLADAVIQLFYDKAESSD